MKKTTSGFTIIELMIVIVVIAILVSITIVGYSSSQTDARNSARVATGNQWVQVFKQYVNFNNDYPPAVLSAASGLKFCLGTGFPLGGGGVPRCQNVTGTDSNSPAESASSTLMSQLNTVVGNLPTSKPFSAPVTGPYLYKVSASDIRVVIGLEGNYAIGDDCGNGFTVVGTNNATWATCHHSI